MWGKNMAINIKEFFKTIDKMVLFSILIRIAVVGVASWKIVISIQQEKQEMAFIESLEKLKVDLRILYTLSPDNKWVFDFQSKNNLEGYRARTKMTETLQLISVDQPEKRINIPIDEAVGLGQGFLRWSPDSKSLAFYGYSYYGYNYFFHDRIIIYRILDDSSVRRYIYRFEYEGYPHIEMAWLPDSSNFVVATGKSIYYFNEKAELIRKIAFPDKTSRIHILDKNALFIQREGLRDGTKVYELWGISLKGNMVETQCIYKSNSSFWLQTVDATGNKFLLGASDSEDVVPHKLVILENHDLLSIREIPINGRFALELNFQNSPYPYNGFGVFRSDYSQDKFDIFNWQTEKIIEHNNVSGIIGWNQTHNGFLVLKDEGEATHLDIIHP
jgi:hypothetical protein